LSGGAVGVWNTGVLGEGAGGVFIGGAIADGGVGDGSSWGTRSGGASPLAGGGGALTLLGDVSAGAEVTGVGTAVPGAVSMGTETVAGPASTA
jgi:hypothetical protein